MPARAGVIGGPVVFAMLIALTGGPALADRSAKIDQVVRKETTGERSNAALDQITPVPRIGRGSIDQIDPSARPRDDDSQYDTAIQHLPGPAQPRGCDVSADQAAIIESLKAQGKIIGDDCDLIDWVAIAGDRSGKDERRAVGEALSATRPELLSLEAQRDKEAAERAEQERLDAARAAVSVLMNGQNPMR
ncbi:MAG: hypothetical protein ACK4MQ_12465 [Hyphomonas sp.]